MNNKKIAVFTSTRAEYGLLYYLLKELQQNDNVSLQLFVGGTHLSSVYGKTIDFITDDGFDVTAALDFFQGSDSVKNIVSSLACCIEQASKVLIQYKPELIVLLGDRYELLGIAQAAMLSNIPIAHIHGGEITEGAVDDMIRHAISKMSHLHFTSTEKYRSRLIQMGEQPDTVFNVGAPGLDHLTKMDFLSAYELSNIFNFDLSTPFFLITYHPVTLSDGEPIKQLNILLATVSLFETYKLVITYPNADSFSQQLIERLLDFDSKNENVLLLSSMGQQRYLSAMKLATVVIGNSSSGIIEAPSCNVPTVNIGDRQKGRLASNSVIHCGENQQEIYNAIEKAINLKKSTDLNVYSNPYGNGGASKKIVEKLLDYEKPLKLYKSFYDVDVN